MGHTIHIILNRQRCRRLAHRQEGRFQSRSLSLDRAGSALRFATRHQNPIQANENFIAALACLRD